MRIASTAGVYTHGEKAVFGERDLLAEQQANPMSTHTEKQSVPTASRNALFVFWEDPKPSDLHDGAA